MKEDKIYNMKLHEILTPNSDLDIQIIRVPGGWIYRFSQLHQAEQPNGQRSENYSCDSVFVPYHEEGE